MNAHIAQLLIDRIVAADMPWVDKYAGLVRPAKFTRSKKLLVIPVACSVQVAENCDPATVEDLVPNEAYRSVIFIEGSGLPSRTLDRAPGVRYTSRLRVVVWINCKLLGGDCDCAADAAMSLMTAIGGNGRNTYSTDLFKGVRHTIVGGTSHGPDVFAGYTFDEARSQYLQPPFDAFAIDVETDMRVMPFCETMLQSDPQTCWPQTP